MGKNLSVLPDFGWIKLSEAFKKSNASLGVTDSEIWELFKKSWENGKLKLRGRSKNKELIEFKPSWARKNGNMVEVGQDNDLPVFYEDIGIIYFDKHPDIIESFQQQDVDRVEVCEDDLSDILKQYLDINKQETNPSDNTKKSQGRPSSKAIIIPEYNRRLASDERCRNWNNEIDYLYNFYNRLPDNQKASEGDKVEKKTIKQYIKLNLFQQEKEIVV